MGKGDDMGGGRRLEEKRWSVWLDAYHGGGDLGRKVLVAAAELRDFDAAFPVQVGGITAAEWGLEAKIPPGVCAECWDHAREYVELHTGEDGE